MRSRRGGSVNGIFSKSEALVRRQPGGCPGSLWTPQAGDEA